MFSLILIGAAFTFATTVGAACPSDLPRNVYSETLGERCFAFFTGHHLDYNHARSDCQNRNGILAMPKDNATNFVLAEILRTKLYPVERAWIGLNDKRTENVFVWEDGNNLAAFHPFGKNEGPHGTWDHITGNAEDCILLDPKAATWHDSHCKDENLGLFKLRFEHQYICQFGPGASTAATV